MGNKGSLPKGVYDEEPERVLYHLSYGGDTYHMDQVPTTHQLQPLTPMPSSGTLLRVSASLH